MRREILFLAALAALVAGRAFAQTDGDATAYQVPTQAALGVQISDNGDCQIGLSIFHKKTPPKREDLEAKLREVLGFPLEDVKVVPAKNYLVLSGRAAAVFPPAGGRIEGELDLAPLAKLLHAADVPTLDVTIVRVGRSSRMAMPIHRKMATALPQPVPFVLAPGYNLWLIVAMLAGIVVVPLGLALWGLRDAERSMEADKAVVWYRYWRWIHWIVVGMWVIWLTASFWVKPEEIVLANLGVQADGWWTALTWLIRLAPPWLMMAVCNALAQVAQARLRQFDQSAGEIFRETAAGLLATFIPLLLGAVGVFLLVDREFRLGAMVLAAAWAARWLLVRLAERFGPDLKAFTLTDGPLRERIFHLAKEAGVALKQVFVIPTGKAPQANAGAVIGGNIVLTDQLLQHLSVRETDGIVAHELAHVKYNHPTWLLVIFFSVLLAASFLVPSVDALPEGFSSLAYRVPLGIAAGALAFYFASRRFEYQTDSYAAWLTGDPEALITALVKLHRLNMMPLEWGKWDEHLLTHPSTSRRLEAIARENGISKQRLNEIIAALDPTPPPLEKAVGADSERTPTVIGVSEAPAQPAVPALSSPGTSAGYDFPRTDAETNKIFSTALRTKVLAWNTRISVTAVVLVPALTAAIVHWTDLQATAKWAVLALGVVATAGIFLALQNFLPVLAYPAMQRRLRETLEAQGLAPPGTNAFFVGLSPDAMPRMYEGFMNWDIGFLCLAGDRLLCLGEQARFGLRHDQITDLRLEWDVKRWWRVPTLYISWQDTEHGTSGTFHVRRGDQLRSMRQMALQTCQLFHELKQWHAQAATPTELPPALAALTTPAFGASTGIDPALVYRPGIVLYQIGFVAVPAFLVSWLLGLPLDVEDATGFYVPAVAASMILFALAPNLWQSTPRPAAPAPSLASAATEGQTNVTTQ